MRPIEIKRFSPVPQEISSSPEFTESMIAIGLSELPKNEAHIKHSELVQRARIGLDRKTPPHIIEGGLAADGGFAAFPTGIPQLTTEAWRNVEEGTQAYVVSVGGTNFEYHHASKKNGLVETKKLGKNSFEKDETKKVTYDTFISRIVDVIANHYNNRVIKPDKLRLGVSLGFPHSNVVANDGVDASLEPIKLDGTLTKQWKITDWQKVPTTDRSLTHAIKKRFVDHGIDPKKVELVILNDTPATALDINAILDAEQRGLTIMPMATVGGTGTNDAVLYNGRLVNMETGRGTIYDCPVTRRMLEIVSRENNEQVLRAELEHEIGGKYIIQRVRAAIEILGEREMIKGDYAQALSDWIGMRAEHDPELISQLARGQTEISDKAVELIAQQALRRAGQFLGLKTAAMAEVVWGTRRGHDPAAVLAEGSFVNHAKSVKRIAENAALILDQPIEIVKASSVVGTAALSMARPYMDLAA